MIGLFKFQPPSFEFEREITIYYNVEPPKRYSYYNSLLVGIVSLIHSYILTVGFCYRFPAKTRIPI